MRDRDDTLTFFYGADKEDEAYKFIEEKLLKEEHYLVDFYNEFLIDVYLLLDNPNSNFIAIDWDNTISADPSCFLRLIKDLQKEGFIPFVCTLRAPDKENIAEIKSVLEETNIAIYLTDGQPKRAYLKSLDLDVRIWIDDFYPGVCRDTSKLLTSNGIS